jgi:hypothetical protein
MKSSMRKIGTNDEMAGPVCDGQGALAAGQRWSVGREREVVLRLLRGERMELLSRELGVPLY